MKHWKKYYSIISLNRESNHALSTLNNDLGHYFQINIWNVWDGSEVGEGANCMHALLQWAQYYYRSQFILERNWYSHLLSQVYLTDPLNVTDTYIYKRLPKKARNQFLHITSVRLTILSFECVVWPIVYEKWEF